MQKKPSALALVLALGAFAPVAHAEDRLFPTDVLKSGETDVAFAFSYLKIKDDNGFFDLKESYETLLARMGFGVLDVGAGIPYINNVEICGGPGPCFKSGGGWMNTSLFANVRLAGGSTDPFSAALKLRYDTNLAGRGGEGYAGGFALGWQSDPSLSFYTSAEYDTFTDSTSGPDSWDARLGAHIGTGDLRFRPEVLYEKITGSGSDHTIGGGLSLLVGLDRRVTLVPEVQYIDDTGVDLKEWTGRLTLYALFGGVESKRAPAPRSHAQPVSEAQAPAAPAAPITPAAPAETPPAPAPAPAPAEAAPPIQAGPHALAKAAPLSPRPRPGAEGVAMLDAGATVNLKSRVVNADGAWWYSDSPKPGWLREADLL